MNRSLLISFAAIILLSLCCVLPSWIDQVSPAAETPTEYSLPAAPDQDIDSIEEPTPDEPEPEPETINESSISHDGVTLYYDPDLILTIETSTVSANSGQDMYEVARPSFPQFHLVLDSGAVSVVSVEAYLAAAGDNEPLLHDIQGFITQQTIPSGGCIPELPLLASYLTCDHQQINANVAFLDFQNGSGIRFVTVYGVQDAAPITNENLAYDFQGFTDDGKYYVKIGFQIIHAGLEGLAYGIPPDVYQDTTGEALQEYFFEFEQMLDNDLDGYGPPLEHLDAIIKSLRIE